MTSYFVYIRNNKPISLQTLSFTKSTHNLELNLVALASFGQQKKGKTGKLTYIYGTPTVAVAINLTELNVLQCHTLYYIKFRKVLFHCIKIVLMEIALS